MIEINFDHVADAKDWSMSTQMKELLAKWALIPSGNCTRYPAPSRLRYNMAVQPVD
jgi:hypothetical protein